jgi:hypothetical protein
MELIRTFQLGSVFGMEEFFNSLTSTLGVPVNEENPPPTEVLLPLRSSWLEPKVLPRYHEPWKSY